MSDDDSEIESSFTELIPRYERVLDGGTRDSRFEETITVLDGMTRHCKQTSLAERGHPAVLREHWYTRLAAALTRFATHPETALNLDELEQICRRKQTIVYIFNASGYRVGTHLISLLSHTSEAGKKSVPLNRATIIFALCGLDDIPEELMDLLPKQRPEVLLILMLGWLNQRAVLTKRGEENRARLLSMGPIVEQAQITDKHIAMVVNAWMYSTYASDSKKHAIKTSFNKLLLDLMQRAPAGQMEQQTARKGRKKKHSRSKPIMVIVHERFTTDHAMYRCYAQPIRDLANFFELVAVVEEEHIDDNSAGIFSRTIRLAKTEKHIWKIKAAIEQIGPDVVYYPSLGMSHWTVLLAQLRLAPMQFMTLGHPATSGSETIDYVYTCEMEGDLSKVFSEKVLVGSAMASFDPHSELPVNLPDLLPASEREVRIAVNSKVMKLSYRLLEICRRLTKDASVPVRFSFFPGERNLFFDGLVPAIKAQLPDAYVHPYISYENFLAEMCKCDLALAAFPFGNTNSTVDTCLLGIPTVVHFGPESPAQSDALVLRTIGMSDELICRSDEEYYQTALRLINNPGDRQKVFGDLSREDVRNRFYRASEQVEKNPFADMIYYAYKNHDKLQAAKERVFHYRDVLGTK